MHIVKIEEIVKVSPTIQQFESICKEWQTQKFKKLVNERIDVATGPNPNELLDTFQASRDTALEDKIFLLLIEHIIGHIIEYKAHRLHQKVAKKGKEGIQAILCDSKILPTIVEDFKIYLQQNIDLIGGLTNAEERDANVRAFKSVITVKLYNAIWAFNPTVESLFGKSPVICSFDFSEEYQVLHPLVPICNPYTLLNVNTLLSILDESVKKNKNFIPEIYVNWNYPPYEAYINIAKNHFQNMPISYENIKTLKEKEGFSIYKNLVLSASSSEYSLTEEQKLRALLNMRFLPREGSKTSIEQKLGKTLHGVKTVFRTAVSPPLLDAITKPVLSPQSNIEIADDMLEYYIQCASERVRHNLRKVIVIAPFDSGEMAHTKVQSLKGFDQKVDYTSLIDFAYYMPLSFSEELLRERFPVYVNERSESIYQKDVDLFRENLKGWQRLQMRPEELRTASFFQMIGEIVERRWPKESVENFQRLVHLILELFTSTAKTTERLVRYI